MKAFSDMVSLMDEGLMPGSEVLSDTKGTRFVSVSEGSHSFHGILETSVIDEASFADQIGTIAMPAKEAGNQSVIGGLGYANQC